MTWPNGIAVEETIMALSAKLTVTETRLAEAEALLRDLWNDSSDWREEVSREMYDRIDAFLNRAGDDAPAP